MSIFSIFKKIFSLGPSLCGSVGCESSHKLKVAGFSTGQGTSPGCGSVPSRGAYEMHPTDVSLTSIFPPFSFSHPSPPSEIKNKN